MNGFLVIDKPAGITSHDVVSRLRKITGERSIGHLGTLDPMASGVLPLLLGKYTRLAQYFSSAEKRYIGAIRFGFATDTWDAEGQPAAHDRWPEFSPNITLEQLRTIAANFHGVIEQMPPPFSAKKISGQPAYKLARAGKPVELKPVKITIVSFEVTALNGSEAEFEVQVSSGGYIRAIAHEMGQILGCGAHLSRLRRTQAGVFTLADAHTLEEVQMVGNKGIQPPESEPQDQGLQAWRHIEALCIHPRNLLPEMPSVGVDDQVLGRLRNGAQANLPEFSTAPLVKVFAGQSDLVAIAKRIAGTLFQPVVVMG